MAFADGQLSLNPQNPSYSTAFENIKNYILHSLGYPLVRVELTEEHIHLAIIDAIQLYFDYAAMDYAITIVIPVDNIVEIPANIDPKRIVDIIFDDNSFGPGGGAIGGNILGALKVGGTVFVQDGSNVQNYIQSFDYVQYYRWLQKLEDMKEVFGIDKHWEIINNQIHLFPSDETFQTVGIYHANMPLLEKMETETWIREYALARSKVFLGTIWRKLSGISFPGGATQLNGGELISEGKEEMDKLREQLLQKRRPLPFLQI